MIAENIVAKSVRANPVKTIISITDETTIGSAVIIETVFRI